MLVSAGFLLVEWEGRNAPGRRRPETDADPAQRQDVAVVLCEDVQRQQDEHQPSKRQVHADDETSVSIHPGKRERGQRVKSR